MRKRLFRAAAVALVTAGRPTTPEPVFAQAVTARSCRTPVIRRPTRRPSGGGEGQPSGRLVTDVPYSPAFETPDEGATNGRLTGIQSVRMSPFVLHTGHAYGRDAARIPQENSLEVVHDQRPATPFRAQNREFRPPTTTRQRHLGSSSSTTTSDSELNRASLNGG